MPISFLIKTYIFPKNISEAIPQFWKTFKFLVLNCQTTIHVKGILLYKEVKHNSLSTLRRRSFAISKNQTKPKCQSHQRKTMVYLNSVIVLGMLSGVPHFQFISHLNSFTDKTLQFFALKVWIVISIQWALFHVSWINK